MIRVLIIATFALLISYIWQGSDFAPTTEKTWPIVLIVASLLGMTFLNRAKRRGKVIDITTLKAWEKEKKEHLIIHIDTQPLESQLSENHLVLNIPADEIVVQLHRLEAYRYTPMVIAGRNSSERCRVTSELTRIGFSHCYQFRL